MRNSNPQFDALLHGTHGDPFALLGPHGNLIRVLVPGAKGVKIQMAGRLGGAEMARTESAMAGSIPLSTLRARVEFGFTEAKTAQGHIGIKVWINNGDYLNPEEDFDAVNAQAREVQKDPAWQGQG